jgi:hypothetical protein
MQEEAKYPHLGKCRAIIQHIEDTYGTDSDPGQRSAYKEALLKYPELEEIRTL